MVCAWRSQCLRCPLASELRRACVTQPRSTTEQGVVVAAGFPTLDLRVSKHYVFWRCERTLALAAASD